MAPSKTHSATQKIRHRKAHEAETNTRNSLIEGYEFLAVLANLQKTQFHWEGASHRVDHKSTTAKESVKGVSDGKVKSLFDKALKDIEESLGYLQGITMGKLAIRRGAPAVSSSILDDGSRFYAGGDDQSSKSALSY
jgi:hypothetical protein